MPFYGHRFGGSYLNHVVGTDLKFCLFPKRCYATGKLLWFTYAYHKIAMWTGPGDIVFEHRYYDKKEYLVAKLKGLV